MLRVFKFLGPCLLWVFLLRDFVSGAIPLNMDTNTIYGVAKYYFNNLLNGVVPLWDPFVTLGRPFYAISICNLFNPVTQVVPLLKILGVDYNIAFIIYMVLYFFAGCSGFYFLAKRLLRDTRLAYLAYLCLMFSSLGLSMFTQMTFLEITVPAIWFFYFLLSFAREQKTGHFLGLCLSVMIIVSAYLPFYFLTVFCVFVLLCVLLCPSSTWDFLKDTGRFVLDHKRLSLVCAAGIIIAAGPLLAYKMLDASGDSVSPGRHCQYSSVEQCYDRTMDRKGGMLYEEIARSGGLGERLDVGYLFAHLDKITYGSDSLFFVPVWIYVLVILSFFLKVDRLNILLAAVMIAIGLIALGDSTPVHRFLYDHLFFFAYFRNLFFLGAFLIPLIILFGLKQLQALLAIRPSDISRKKAMVIGILLMHGAFMVFLRRFEGVMAVSFVTVALSAALFAIYYSGFFRWGMNVWGWLLAALLVIQPVAVMAAYSANAGEFKCVLPSNHVRPVFAWIRPDVPAVSSCRIYQFVPYEDFWYAMSMTDAPAKVGYPQAAARWAFALSQRLGEAQLAAYAQYKVYLYDDANAPGIAVTGPSDALDIAHFDVNRVGFKTKFDQRKFLVYNDSYTRAWHAYVDGHLQQLQIANGAFKGVWVPRGEHRVEFRYQPFGGQWVYVLTAIFLFVFLVYAGIMLYWKR
ncbi:MAG: YfhO family protein [Candidatus Omnitrophica bacterium]|nr:YfhO family protein [Candidatus Omnitrophota bacterium]